MHDDQASAAAERPGRRSVSASFGHDLDDARSGRGMVAQSRWSQPIDFRPATADAVKAEWPRHDAAPGPGARATSGMVLATRRAMAESPKTLAKQLRAFETDAEVLVVLQLDLLAIMEAQLRSVHHTMRSIERLRGGKLRVGPALTNVQRGSALSGLSKEVEAIVDQLAEEHEATREMQSCVEKMQQCLVNMQHAAAILERGSDRTR
jgi:hypothetical protein